MFKKITSIILSLILLVSCSKMNNSLDALNLKGRVKKVKEVNHMAKDKFGEFEKIGITYSVDIFSFDIEEKEYYDNNLFSTTIYKYDENNNLIYEKYDDFEDKKDYDVSMKYDDNGDIIEKIRHFMRGDSKIEFTYHSDYQEYDNNGNWISKNYKVQKGRSIIEREIEYY